MACVTAMVSLHTNGGRVGSGHRPASLTTEQSGCSSHRPCATEVEAHAQSLRKACTLLRRHVQKELAAGQWSCLDLGGG